MSFIADYDGLDFGGAEACSLNPASPYTATILQAPNLARVPVLLSHTLHRPEGEDIF